MPLQNPTIAGLYDTAGRRHGNLFMSDGDLFDRMGELQAQPASASPWADAFTAISSQLIQYRRDKDLSKLNRHLMDQGQAPMTAAEAAGLAAHASAVPSWLPWAAAGALGLFLVMQRGGRK